MIDRTNAHGRRSVGIDWSESVVFQHGGNLRDLARRAGLRPQTILDFSANINPLGPPDCIRPVISRAIEQLVNYPDPDAAELVEAIARRYGVPADQIVVGNGSTELLFALARGINAKPQAGCRAVIPVPSYIDYAAAAQLAGFSVDSLPLREDSGFALEWGALKARLDQEGTRDALVFLGQPNNPTGVMFDGDEFRRLAAGHPATRFVVDEAFAGFVDGYQTLARDVPANTIVLCSLTKLYAIPGLRLGFAVAQPELARRIRRQLPDWSVNTLAQAVGAAVLADEEYARRTVDYVTQQREALIGQLAELHELHVYPGRANYLLVRLDRPDLGAATLAGRLLADGIAIRTFLVDQHLDDRFFRIAVRTEEENQRLIEAMSRALGGTHPHPALSQGERVNWKRRAPAIMFQGTSSNAGKSILTAAMCRILLQDGVRVAPFKSQNMSLNSFVTRDGGEIGRAQAVQAQACRLEPDIRFNPILLKPNSDTGSQVIVRGQPVGNMRVMDYVRYKPTAFAAAKECYDSLASEFDAIVLEGAGSPGEVNLKSHDIVNMRMAHYAGAAVLVVGDIDRGGVFAAFVGTMEVLSPWERALVRGWIVNRFRGDASLLASALDYTLAHTGRPVLGVVPFLSDLNIPQEDSVDFKDRASRTNRETASGRRPGSPQLASSQSADGSNRDRDNHSVQIAVIDLPHISNFTDLDAFAVEPDVRVQIVRSAGELDRPDAVIIPGSKNTLADLAYLKGSGLAGRIARLAAEGNAEIVGICGGFQMLGRRIGDPHGIESGDGKAGAAGAAGLGLLDVDTVLAAEKTLIRTTAKHAPSGLAVTGYEIHHGRTGGDEIVPLFARVLAQESPGPPCGDKDGLLGAAAANGRLWGTYLHGVFDADAFRRWFIDRLRVRRGLPPTGKVVACYDIESALDRLAEAVRKSLNMDEVYRLLRL